MGSNKKKNQRSIKAGKGSRSLQRKSVRDIIKGKEAEKTIKKDRAFG